MKTQKKGFFEPITAAIVLIAIAFIAILWWVFAPKAAIPYEFPVTTTPVSPRVTVTVVPPSAGGEMVQVQCYDKLTNPVPCSTPPGGELSIVCVNAVCGPTHEGKYWLSFNITSRNSGTQTLDLFNIKSATGCIGSDKKCDLYNVMKKSYIYGTTFSAGSPPNATSISAGATAVWDSSKTSAGAACTINADCDAEEWCSSSVPGAPIPYKCLIPVFSCYDTDWSSVDGGDECFAVTSGSAACTSKSTECAWWKQNYDYQCNSITGTGICTFGTTVASKYTYAQQTKYPEKSCTGIGCPNVEVKPDPEFNFEVTVVSG